jgi:cold shock CspA family protein
MIGSLKTWKHNKRFGLIATASGDVYFDRPACNAAPEYWSRGDRLTFDLVKGHDGRPRATNVSAG